MVQLWTAGATHGMDVSPVFMEDPIMPEDVLGTARLLTGHLHMDSRYRTQRPEGTTDWLLMHTRGGAGRIATGSSELALPPGAAVLVPPSVAHDYGTAPEADHWELVFAHVLPPAAWAPLLRWPIAGRGVRSVVVGETVRSRVEAALARMVNAGRTGLSQSTALAVNALEEALLWYDTANPTHGRIDARLLPVLDHIAADLGAPLSVASLAEIAGLSPSRLSQLFVDHLGTSVMQYVESRRMEVARDLIRLTSLPIHQVARRIGYADPLYFSKRFRHAVGLSPSAFRRSAASSVAAPAVGSTG